MKKRRNPKSMKHKKHHKHNTNRIGGLQTNMVVFPINTGGASTF